MTVTTTAPRWLNIDEISTAAEIAERRAHAAQGRALLTLLVPWAREAAALRRVDLAPLEGEAFDVVVEEIGLAELDDVGLLLELLAADVLDPGDCNLSDATISRLRAQYRELVTKASTRGE